MIQTDTSRIAVEGLEKTYVMGKSRVRALDGLDLTIDEPGFYAVMGASGSGKSTLLHLLAGLDQADAGSIEVGGTQVHTLSEADLTLYRRRTIGVVFQQFNLLPTLTALENVVLPGVLDRMNEDEMQQRGLQLLDEMGLSERVHHRPDAMSGGEQQRVAIARALFFTPKILFADEPTGNLDSAASHKLWNSFRSLAEERNMIILMVTHETDAATHCRRAIVLRDGRSAGVIDVQDLSASELAARASTLARPA